jgi:PAS domain S-box-containing protein
VNVSISVSTIKDHAGRIVGVSRISRDITVQKDHEREIARVSRLYAALSQINQAIVWTSDRVELFRKICRILVEDGQFHMAWIAWHDPETEELVPVADWGDKNGYIRNVKVYADDRLEGRGPSGLAFRAGQPYVCNDMLNNPVTLPWRAEIARCGFRATAVFPIRTKDKVAGTLNVYSDDPVFFRDKEIALLTEAARDISFALENLVRQQEHQKAEEIARSEKLFSDTMIESMPGILYFYTDRGRFLRWSRNFEVISGYSAEEISPLHPLHFILDKDKQLVQQRIADVFEKGEASVEASLIAKDGTVSPYFFTGRRIVFNGVACLVGMGIDISERMRAENSLRELNETLELKISTRTLALQAALVRAESADHIKSAFLATMSHELRTPLNSIIGFTGILLQGLTGPLAPEQLKQLGMVRNSARHLLELINDVLDLSKIEAGQLEVRAEPFQLSAPIERAAALVKPLADKKGLVLSVVLPSDLGKMVSDRRRLEQILLNLLTNAIKFTDAGKVTLTAEAIQNFQSFPNAAPQRAVRLHVADTGIGIKLKDLTTLFQPFRQIDNGGTHPQEGTGLGLAICHRLIFLLGGNISVISEWGLGSAFTVVLPLDRSA